MPYSPIRHIAHSVFLRSNVDGALMAMFTAYFDDSGKSTQGSLLTVGGAVSSVEKWERLGREWQDILKEYGIQQFHMKDLYGNYREFSGWEKRGAEKEVLLRRLSECIKRGTHKTISVSVLLRDWRAVNRDFRLNEEIGTPYPFCAFGCVAHVNEWAKKRSLPLEQIQCFFEHGSEDRGIFLRLCKREYGIEPLNVGKIAPIQAADLIAWEGRRHLSDLVDKDVRNGRASRLTLERKANKSAVFPRDQLRELCKQAGVPGR